MPAFVEREFQAYLACGDPMNGVVRVHCDGCGFDRLVPFSCKGRSFCPSCMGRRMADTAAHLVDRVIPHVQVRQWVVTLPVVLRYRMAFDAKLTTDVLCAFMRTLFASLRRRARAERKIGYPQCGSVSFIQRFGDALNLNVHFHVLTLDGVFDADHPEGVVFYPLDAPDDEELLRIVRAFQRRLGVVLQRHGIDAEARTVEADPLADDQPLLAELTSAAAQGLVATGPRRGRGVARLGDRIAPETLQNPGLPPGCVTENGISLHAGVAVPARDRQRLERLCRYAARPPVATERLSRQPDGRLLYRLRHRWRDGTTHMLFEPLELIERLAILVPPPRFHMVRYYGILAPAASCRDLVAPAVADDSAAPGEADDLDETPSQTKRHAWAMLLARVFAIDVQTCPRCGATMRILAAIHSPEAIRKILDCIGLASRPPPDAAETTTAGITSPL